jgi:hypothetical protein
MTISEPFALLQHLIEIQVTAFGRIRAPPAICNPSVDFIVALQIWQLGYSTCAGYSFIR